ncbi:MAG: hypothetical protein LC107_09445 [Chitinophagales bacterium]|nr:hypothetical protein [Chitinophagales bacterium]
MTKKFLAIFVFCVVLFGANAQSEMRKFDIKIGVGVGQDRLNDVLLYNLENELTYKMNTYFIASAFVNLGRGGELNPDHLAIGDSNVSSVLGGFNILISPFKNNKVNNFKVGAGIGWFRSTETYVRYNFKNYEYNYIEDKGVGLNLIVEDEYRIKDRYLLGLKFYLNGEKYIADALGGLLRFGVIF